MQPDEELLGPRIGQQRREARRAEPVLPSFVPLFPALLFPLPFLARPLSCLRLLRIKTHLRRPDPPRALNPLKVALPRVPVRRVLDLPQGEDRPLRPDRQCRVVRLAVNLGVRFSRCVRRVGSRRGGGRPRLLPRCARSAVTVLRLRLRPRPRLRQARLLEREHPLAALAPLGAVLGRPSPVRAEDPALAAALAPRGRVLVDGVVGDRVAEELEVDLFGGRGGAGSACVGDGQRESRRLTDADLVRATGDGAACECA